MSPIVFEIGKGFVKNDNPLIIEPQVQTYDE